MSYHFGMYSVHCCQICWKILSEVRAPPSYLKCRDFEWFITVALWSRSPLCRLSGSGTRPWGKRMITETLWQRWKANVIMFICMGYMGLYVWVLIGPLYLWNCVWFCENSTPPNWNSFGTYFTNWINLFWSRKFIFTLSSGSTFHENFMFCVLTLLGLENDWFF